MEITLAKSAGFCFGVRRAVETVERLLREGRTVCTLGPIIHNPQLVAELEQRGVRAVNAPADVPAGATLVLRSHGIPAGTMQEIRERGILFEDATCPFVAKIHRIVQQASAEGKWILIAGDRKHPEVIGIQSHCPDCSSVFGESCELDDLLKTLQKNGITSVCVVAQTTFRMEEWKNCLKKIKMVYTNAAVFDTICNATAERQSEAAQLAAASDAMIVIGGRQSSNTAKLFEICRAECPSYLVETAAELPLDKLRSAGRIGVTAGASTPVGIIKEVLQTMTEILNNEQLNSTEAESNTSAEGNFAEMLEESLKTLNTDEKVHGVVVGIAPNEIYVDVGRKQAGFVPLSELTNDPSARTEDLVKVGDEMDLLIMRTNDQEGTIMLSKRRLDAQKGWEQISAAAEDQSVLTGVVTEVIKGGVIVLCNGVRVFVPASQATASRGEPLEGLLKQEVQFRILEVNRGRRRAVGSIRSVLADKKKELEEKFWETAEEGKVYTGVVKSLTAYGAFVDIGGVDGMIHISELSWTRIKNPSEVLAVGQTVEVYILKLDREKKKISLGYKKAEDNPWTILEEKYPVGTVCDVTVVGMTDFGAFARVIPGIDGLIHISQISNERINKPQDVLTVGQTVTVKITAIDFEKKRVSLSMKEAAAPEAAGEEAAE
ncbi:MAG: bifunctional 4-hydroxy-3-methylbut-2-enyl diphosphate reductase/30S ribosomal protein S1 [Firmicutes bacterium]|nr:bifunctional 4-hydroxy-3-methylbut-2-enyl diphosphate reductase/30S ribosomal protein S1 [Bacillota bacterium]